MRKVQVWPPPSREAQQYASSPCFLHQVESSLGYWAPEEELTFLNELLRLERKGTKAFAAVGKRADLRIADLVLEMELLQASFCVFLRGGIETRGGKVLPPSPDKKMFAGVNAKPGLAQTISIATRNQQELVETIQNALLKLLDPELSAALVGMQTLHHKNIERLKDLLK